MPAPTQPEPARHAALLDELVVLGTDLARQIHAAAGTTLPLDGAAAAFDRVARAVRRTVALARRLDAPAPTRPDTRTEARKRIIRGVEDTIERVAALSPAVGAERDALVAEFAERLDDPALEEEIDHRPAAEIIADICHDLGLIGSTGPALWKRRTPDEIHALLDRAEARPGSRRSPSRRPPAPPH